MPYVHLYTRMIPGPKDKADEYPFKLRHVDRLEYMDDEEGHREEIVATILLENGVEPGREYEGQLWNLIDDREGEPLGVLGWMAGGPWSTQTLEIGSWRH